jgi:hypothetical protein
MVKNAVHALLIGANLDIKFWPYAFHHWICIDNSLPSHDQADAPLKIATGEHDDFSSWHTFGCRVWVQPPGHCLAKFCTASSNRLTKDKRKKKKRRHIGGASRDTAVNGRKCEVISGIVPEERYNRKFESKS